MRKLLWGALLAASLVGCGGSGDDGTPTDGSPRSTAASSTFPLKAAYEGYISQAQVYSYALTGSCGGNGSETTSPPTPNTFNGVPILVKTQTVRITRDSCITVGPNMTPVAQPGTEVIVTQQAFSLNLTPLGMRIPDTGAIIVWTNTTPIPTSVRVGDSAVLTSGNVGSISYLVEADSTDSVFVKVIAKVNDTGMTATTTYRLTAGGSLTLLEHEIMTGNGVTYILTPR